MSLEKTYTIVEPPTHAMSWDEYQSIVSAEWAKLLRSEPPVAERALQRFLETHPCLLPWIEGEFGGGHHGAFPQAVVTQPILPGLASKVPDFLWIARDSEAVYPVLIEIETPDKPWATKAGQQHSMLTQAINQLKDWKAWFADPLNAAQFKRIYQIPSYLTYSRAFEPRYVLVYGRRADPTLSTSFRRKRKSLAGEDERFMTFDRLTPNQSLANYITVRLDKNGFHAVAVPPTLRLGPLPAVDFSYADGKAEAVMRSPYISAARREFLVQRWPYWDNWARDGAKGTKSTGDWE